MQQHTTQTFFISDLLGAKIVTAEGKVLGHVADIELSPAPEYKVIACFFGLHGWLYRLHVLNPFRADRAAPRMPDRLPWEAIASCQNGLITLKPGYKEKQEFCPPT